MSHPTGRIYDRDFARRVVRPLWSRCAHNQHGGCRPGSAAGWMATVIVLPDMGALWGLPAADGDNSGSVIVVILFLSPCP